MPRAVRNPKGAILSALSSGELSWTQLRQKSALSKSALSKYLDKLINKEKYVETRVDTTKRPPRTLYKLVKVDFRLPKEFYEDPVKFYELLVKSATIHASEDGAKIGQMKDRKKAEDVLRRYLKTHLNWIALVISDSMYKENEYAKGFMDGRPSFIRSKDATKELEKRRDVFHKRVREYLIRGFLEPWIEALADAYFDNVDIAEEVFAQTAKEFGRQAEVSWVNVLEETG